MRQEIAIDRFRGALLGLAAGDAVGTTLEFTTPGSFMPITDMVGGGPFKLEPGQWTDDTSMALCLAESLVLKQGFDARDQMRRYLRWYREGYLSSNGTCFDIGNTVSEALRSFEKTGEPMSGSTHPYSAGNGSIMRLAPIALAYVRSPIQAITLAGESSRTTHGAEAAIDACRYMSALIVGALNGAAKHELLAPHYCPIEGYWSEKPLMTDIKAIAAGSFKEKTPPPAPNAMASYMDMSKSSPNHIRGSGYVVASLEAALWAFFMSQNFAEGCLLAANLGEDADTTAAVYGQIAGAYYGAAGIPENWLEKVALREKIESLATGLYEFSNVNPTPSA